MLERGKLPDKSGKLNRSQFAKRWSGLSKCDGLAKVSLWFHSDVSQR